MKVLVDGSDIQKVNKIVIITFLDGLVKRYGKDLYIIYTGAGYVSDTVEEWLNSTWPGNFSKNCFNAEWFIKHWSGDCGDEGLGSDLVKETSPDLIFLFGQSRYKFHYPARHHDIPLYIVTKDE